MNTNTNSATDATNNESGLISQKAEKVNNISQAGMTGNQHIRGGTEPVQSRYESGTPPVRPRDQAEIPPGSRKAAILQKWLESCSTTEPAASIPKKQPNPNPATHSKLDDLPPEVFAEVLHLIETKTFDEALVHVTARPPHGLGIQTSRSSLERLHKRHRAAMIARQRDDSAEAAAEILKSATVSDEDFSRTTVHLLRFHLLRHAMTDKTSPDQMFMLSRVLDRLRAGDFTERRLRLAESRVEKPSSKSP